MVCTLYSPPDYYNNNNSYNSYTNLYCGLSESANMLYNVIIISLFTPFGVSLPFCTANTYRAMTIGVTLDFGNPHRYPFISWIESVIVD